MSFSGCGPGINSSVGLPYMPRAPQRAAPSSHHFTGSAGAPASAAFDAVVDGAANQRLVARAENRAHGLRTARADDAAEAQDAARRAESTQARLRAAEDDLAAATHDIVRAKALMAIGDVLADAQDVSAAKSYYERSLEMVDRLAGSKPEDMDGWRAKIVVLTRLGDLFDLWDQPMSTAYHQQSLEIAERLLKEHPGSQVAQREVREALTRVGGAAVMSDDPATSIPVLSRAMTIAQSLVDANPGDTGAQNDLFLCYVHLGFASDNLNDSDGKMTWWRKAVALGEALERAAALPLESQGHLAVARSRLIK